MAGSGRRRQVELAAADPLDRWLVAEAPVLVEEYDIDPRRLHADPDAAFAAAREGFEPLVAARDLPGHGDDPPSDANTLTTLGGTKVVGESNRRHEAAVLTYQCPRDHETTVHQPLLRTWAVDTCGERDCHHDVVPDDARTGRGRSPGSPSTAPAGRSPASPPAATPSTGSTDS